MSVRSVRASAPRLADCDRHGTDIFPKALRVQQSDGFVHQVRIVPSARHGPSAVPVVPDNQPTLVRMIDGMVAASAELFMDVPAMELMLDPRHAGGVIICIVLDIIEIPLHGHCHGGIDQMSITLRESALHDPPHARSCNLNDPALLHDTAHQGVRNVIVPQTMCSQDMRRLTQ